MHVERRRNSLIVILALCAAVPLLGGCSRSPWVEAYEPAGAWGDAGLVGGEVAAAAARAEDAPVAVREIPGDRMSAVLEEEEARLTATDLHPDDWTPERGLEHRAMLLRGLQVQGDPARIEVLGRSAFRTLESVRPTGADREPLERQARRVGATDVVVATTFLGRVDTIVDRPVTTFGFGGGFGWYGGGRYPYRGLRSGTSWVPVRTEADQVGVVSFFLRRLDAGT